jgi:hypothetical protein
MREGRRQSRYGDLYHTAQTWRRRQVRISNHDVQSRNAQELEDERFCRFLGYTYMTCLSIPMAESAASRMLPECITSGLHPFWGELVPE